MMDDSVTPELIEAARAWFAECDWADLDDTDFAALTPEQVVRAVNRAYVGGWAQFVADGPEGES